MSKVYGYCRISTKQQSIARQIRNIKEAYPTAVITEEVFTGTQTTERKVFTKLMDTAKAGDTIVFDSVSRMSRNAKEGFELYQNFFKQGIEHGNPRTIQQCAKMCLLRHLLLAKISIYIQ